METVDQRLLPPNDRPVIELVSIPTKTSGKCHGRSGRNAIRRLQKFERCENLMEA